MRELVRRRGGSLVEVIREAVDAYLVRAGTDADEALGLTFGVAPSFQAPSRKDWAQREECIRSG